MNLEQLPLRRASVNGLSIAYRDWGSGEPLLLVHGLGAHSGLWRHQADAFGDRFRVIAVDLRGFGASDKPRTPESYRVPAFVDDLVALMRELGLGGVRVIGTSMGGFMAQEMALREPSLVRRVVLAHTAARLTIPPDVLAARVAGLRASSMADYGKLVATQALARGAESPLFDWLSRMIADNDREAYEHVLTQGLTDFDVRDRLESFPVPALVVVGDTDRVIPPESGRELASLLPSAELETLREAGHIGYAEQPEAFNARVLRFLTA